MSDYFLELSYDGTRFRGWQRQPGGVPTVQEHLEDTLSEILRRPVTVGGCGRTDAGVHATQFYAHLRLTAPPRPDFLFILNKRLPAGIAVRHLLPVSQKAQARYDATGRTYDYYLHAHPDAFLDRLSTLEPDLPELDHAAVHAALGLLLTHDEFRAFCKTPDRHNTTVCRLTTAEMSVEESGRRWRFRFSANRFLRGMIRLLVNDLLDVGRGKLPLTVLERMLREGERERRFRLAPPEGLYLTGVRYPYVRPVPAPAPVDGGAWIASR